MEDKEVDGSAAVTKTLRTDWRSGKPVLLRDAAFWSEHEKRRIEQGLSMPAYCEANGLALSTYRHRTNGQPRRRSGSLPETAAPTPATARFIAVTPAPDEAGCVVEVRLGEGVSVSLAGSAAERVLAQLLARLS